MPITEDDKDKIRFEVISEIRAAVSAAIKSVKAPNVSSFKPEGQLQQLIHENSMKPIKALEKTLSDMERKTRAKIIRKTDPKRAEVIENFKGEF